MLNWLKKLFSTEETLYTQRESEGTIGIERPKITPTIEEGKPEPKQVKETQPVKEKPTEEKKRGRKKTGVTKTDLNKMTKDELEAYAKKEYKVDLDKRRKKADLVEEVLKLAK